MQIFDIKKGERVVQNTFYAENISPHVTPSAQSGVEVCLVGLMLQGEHTGIEALGTFWVGVLFRVQMSMFICELDSVLDLLLVLVSWGGGGLNDVREKLGLSYVVQYHD